MRAHVTGRAWRRVAHFSAWRPGLAAAAACLLAVVLSPATSRAADVPAGRPNIVYILCDDLGYGDVAALNPGARVATPNMDSLARDGMGRRAIARALGVSRNTVRHILAAHAKQRSAEHSALAPPPARVPRAKKVDGFEGRIAELFGRYPDITAQRIFETLREEGFSGGYTAIKDHVRKVRPPKKPAPSLTTPSYGPMGESDWSPYKIRFTTGITGGMSPCFLR